MEGRIDVRRKALQDNPEDRIAKYELGEEFNRKRILPITEQDAKAHCFYHKIMCSKEDIDIRGREAAIKALENASIYGHIDTVLSHHVIKNTSNALQEDPSDLETRKQFVRLLPFYRNLLSYTAGNKTYWQPARTYLNSIRECKPEDNEELREKWDDAYSQLDLFRIRRETSEGMEGETLANRVIGVGANLLMGGIQYFTRRGNEELTETYNGWDGENDLEFAISYLEKTLGELPEVTSEQISLWSLFGTDEGYVKGLGLLADILLPGGTYILDSKPKEGEQRTLCHRLALGVRNSHAIAEIINVGDMPLRGNGSATALDNRGMTLNLFPEVLDNAELHLGEAGIVNGFRIAPSAKCFIHGEFSPLEYRPEDYEGIFVGIPPKYSDSEPYIGEKEEESRAQLEAIMEYSGIPFNEPPTENI